jgi:hypothetical protein
MANVVYRESPRLYQPAETYVNLVAHLNMLTALPAPGALTWNNAWTCAQSAAVTINLLCYDFRDEMMRMQNPHMLPAGVYDDVNDLLRMGLWAAHVVFMAAWDARRMVLNGNPRNALDNIFINNVQSILSHLMEIGARLFGVTAQALRQHARYIELQNEIQTWKAVAPNLSALGFMELLLRIKAQRAATLSNL